MTKVKTLIIGAGISGLASALYLGDDYLIVEKEATPGGYCRTIKRNGFIWDYAGHFYHFRNEELKKLFRESLPESEILNKVKCTKIYYKGKLIDYPFQTNIHQLEKDEFIDCLYDLFFKTEKESYDSFLDMLYGKFGVSITEKFLRPYNEKLYSVDLTQLDRDAMGRFFPYADLEQIIRNMKAGDNASYNNTFLYPKGGAQAYIDVLESKLDPTKIRYNTEIVSVDRKAKTAATSDGEVIAYDNLISSAPLNTLLPMLGDGELASKLSYNRVLVFNLGFDKKSPNFTEEHWLYLPEKKYNFYRCGFYDNIMDSDRLSMYIEIGFGKDGEVDIDRELEATLRGLREIGVTDETMTLVDYEPILMDPAYVHINTETERALSVWRESAARDGIYSIGRYGAWTYCSMEDCMSEARNLAERLSDNK